MLPCIDIFFAGVPGEPRFRVLYSNSNFRICFEAYSHPRYPVVYNITINYNTNFLRRVLHFYLNDSQCLTLLSSEDYIDSGVWCSPFEVSITAANQLGESLKTEVIARGIGLIRTIICTDRYTFVV